MIDNRPKPNPLEDEVLEKLRAYWYRYGILRTEPTVPASMNILKPLIKDSNIRAKVKLIDEIISWMYHKNVTVNKLSLLAELSHLDRKITGGKLLKSYHHKPKIVSF